MGPSFSLNAIYCFFPTAAATNVLRTSAPDNEERLVGKTTKKKRTCTLPCRMYVARARAYYGGEKQSGPKMPTRKYWNSPVFPYCKREDHFRISSQHKRFFMCRDRLAWFFSLVMRRHHRQYGPTVTANSKIRAVCLRNPCAVLMGGGGGDRMGGVEPIT